MKSEILILAIIFCLTGAGCGRKAEALKAAADYPTPRPNPLAFVLSPHQGDGRLDGDIRRVQEGLRGGKEPEVLLERLGWLFVKKARESFDPGYYKLAEQCALAIEAQHPRSHDALLLQGHVLHNLHHFAEAERLARQLAAERGLPFDFGLLSDALMEQGKLNQAVEACQKMMDLRPDLHSYSRGAHLRWLKGDIRGAESLMRMAASAATPQDAESAAWVNTRLAGYEFQLGALADAERDCSLAMDFQNDYPPVLLLRGRMALAQGQTAVATDLLRRAAALNPLPEYQWTLAEALREQGLDAEVESVERLLHQKGAIADPRTYSAYLATRGESNDLALRLAQAEIITRGDVFTHDALGWALAAAGNLEAARREIELAMADGTQDARLFLHAAVIMDKIGNQPEARGYAQKAAAMQQTLLPSERAQLHHFPLTKNVMVLSGN
jgi:tetratricopeptide (TPR) repeat protein